MARVNNPVIGYWKCAADGRATVHQAKRGKGRYLYTRCDCCGCDQRSGKVRQQQLLDETEWLEGPPSVLPPDCKLGNFDFDKPVVEPDGEPVQEPETTGTKKPSGVSGGLVIGGFLALCGIGLVAFGGNS